MRRPARAAIVLVLALAGCGRDGETGAAEVAAADVAVTLPALPGRPGAAYFRLETSGEGVRLTGLSSAAAERIELHETGMRPAAAIALPAGEPLSFAPGGRHAMLFGLDPSLRAGGSIALTFTFEGARPVTVQAQVRRPGGVHGSD
jgi:hypothetical protein